MYSSPMALKYYAEMPRFGEHGQRVRDEFFTKDMLMPKRYRHEHDHAGSRNPEIPHRPDLRRQLKSRFKFRRPVEERICIVQASMTFACGLYDRMLSLHPGEVAADGIDLNFINIDIPASCSSDGRQARVRCFRNVELEYVSRFAAGDCPFVALRCRSRVFRMVSSRSHARPSARPGPRRQRSAFSSTA